METKDSTDQIPQGFTDVGHDDRRKDVDRFVGFVEMGIDFWLKAGAVLVEMRKKEHDIFDAIRKQHRWITVEMLETLHSIGMKTLHPKVLLLPNNVSGAVAMMPYADQVAIVEGGGRLSVAISAAGAGREGNHTTMLKRVDEMSGREARRAMSPSGPVAPEKQILGSNHELLGVFLVTLVSGRASIRRLSDKDPRGRTIRFENGQAIVRFIK